MNFLQRILARALPPPQPLTLENLFPTRYATSGIDVSEESALNYSPIWSGVSTLSRDIAKLPLVLNRVLPNGGSERFKTHRLYRILHDEWNSEMTSFKARETMQALCLLYGNAYAVIVRDELNRIAELYPIIPSRVAPIRDRDSGRLVYRITNYRGGQSYLKPSDVIHISSLSTDGIIGHGIVEHARESIGLGIAAEKFGGSFYGNGTVFGGIVEIPTPLTAANRELADNTRAAIEAVHQGVERAHRLLVLGAGTKFTPRGTTPNDAQFVESRKFQVTEVARWLNMPAHKLGDLENAHFTNIEEQELQYYQGCVHGWLEMWEQELQRKLIAPLEYAQQSIEHVMEGALRGTSAQRAEFYAKLFSIGAISVNRILQLENMNPIGPAGDVHLVPLNMIPLERYNEYIDATVLAPKPQEQLPPKPEADAEEKAKRFIEAMRGELESRIAEETRRQQEVRDQIGQLLIAHGEKVDEVGRTVLAKVTDEWEAQNARNDLVAAESAANATARAAAEATAEAQRAEAERLRTERDAAAATAAAHEIRLNEANDALTAKVQALTEAEQRLTEAEARAAEHRSHADVAEEERRLALLDVDAAKRDVAAKAAALEEAQRKLDAMREARQTIEARAIQTDARVAQLEAVTAEERDRRVRMVAAHRELFIDALKRIARTETERARKRGGQPETLRKWWEAFYDEQGRQIVSDILYPAVYAHLSWKRSDDDARTVARTMADAYCDESVSQLRALADGMVGEEFQSSLAFTLNRWEHERPAQLADKVLHDEVKHLAN